VLDGERAGSRFIAVTDPGSKLQQLAERDGFRRVTMGNPNIGGRYSVLSDFGMVPAALMGLDVKTLLTCAQLMQRSCGPSVPPAENPGIELGMIMGQLAKAGRDKVTVVTSPTIASFGAWLEQLLAESTGKQGKGLVPVDGEPLGQPDVYGRDRVFVHMRLTNDADSVQDNAVAALERAGHPIVRIAVADRYHIGQEFFRWEMATAVAGAILGINPFNQPDVEASKVKTHALIAAYKATGKLPVQAPLLRDRGIQVFADTSNGVALRKSGATLVGCLREHLSRVRAGDYWALLAYIERNRLHTESLQEIRRVVRDRMRVATCLGFGPRFLHSTGQVYKGGPNTGVFLQITSEEANDVNVPAQEYSFGVVKAAQARGDLEVLVERGRRVLRIHLGTHVLDGLTTLKAAIQQALA
jgi:transaldolase / glucose-6-phosphate isomerase